MSLPATWVERIFGHISALYGSKFLDMWRGQDVNAVKAIWSEKLGGFSDKPHAIKAALDALDEKPFPPTLPEFLHMCRDAARRINPTALQLEHKATPEQIENNRRRIREITESLFKGFNHA